MSDQYIAQEGGCGEARLTRWSWSPIRKGYCHRRVLYKRGPITSGCSTLVKNELRTHLQRNHQPVSSWVLWVASWAKGYWIVFGSVPAMSSWAEREHRLGSKDSTPKMVDRVRVNLVRRTRGVIPLAEILHLILSSTVTTVLSGTNENSTTSSSVESLCISCRPH